MSLSELLCHNDITDRITDSRFYLYVLLQSSCESSYCDEHNYGDKLCKFTLESSYPYLQLVL